MLVVAAALALAPATAQADGDPASDVLLLQDVYLPYAPGIPTPLGKTITDLLKTTRKAGFPLKVAIIADPKDLGAVPQFFGKPQSYAPFLESEIAFNTKKPLLTVMSTGYGGAALPPGATAVFKDLGVPKSASGEDLGRGAVAAIVKLSAAAGHPGAHAEAAEGDRRGRRRQHLADHRVRRAGGAARARRRCSWRCAAARTPPPRPESPYNRGGAGTYVDPADGGADGSRLLRRPSAALRPVL